MADTKEKGRGFIPNTTAQEAAHHEGMAKYLRARGYPELARQHEFHAKYFRWLGGLS